MKITYFKIIIVIITLTTNCAYYNTLFNAIESYESGTTKLEKSKTGAITSDIKKDYQRTIDKCWKVINLHGDSSSYADDAFILIAKSNYQLKEYIKAERFFRQFIQKYSDSEYFSEAKLWLARSLIKNENDEEALEHLTELIESETNNEITSIALFDVGELHYKKNSNNDAIKSLKQCVESSEDEILAAKAQFKIGNIYFENEEYIKSIDNYNRVLDFEAPIVIEFDSQIKKIEAQIILEEYDLALKSLQSLLRDARFKDNFALIEAKIGEIYFLKGDLENASNHYSWVIKKYPKTEGSAYAAYKLAKIMEFTYTNIDSAFKLYSSVKTEFSSSNFAIDSNIRSNLLKTYLKLKNNIEIDIDDLSKLHKGNGNDSLGFEEIVKDSMEVLEDDPPEENQISTDSDLSTTESTKSMKTEQKKSVEKKQKKKKRSELDIQKALKKNKFAFAEFFLLTMQNYDSAEVAYLDFVESIEDTILVPKAYYTLYYLYSYKLQDSLKSDLIKNIILKKYPSTIYADNIRGNQDEQIIESTNENDQYKELYLQSETFLYKNNFNDALMLFDKIAREDSGSVWAEKSRFTIAWLYENKLNDIPKAIDAYTVIIKEYPKSEGAKIAKNKIKEPPKAVEKIEKEDDTPDMNGKKNIELLENNKIEKQKFQMDPDRYKEERPNKEFLPDTVDNDSAKKLEERSVKPNKEENSQEKIKNKKEDK